MKKLFENVRLFFKFINSKKEQQVARKLFNMSMTIATAESCTGGLISSRLTNISGSSSFVKENFITYSIDSKVDTLGVSRELIEKSGVVSDDCAIAMADGLYKKTNRDICLAITGVAGPSKVDDIPVGTAYICVKNKYTSQLKKVIINKHLSRRMMKFVFSEAAFDLLLEFLDANYTATADVMIDSNTSL